MADKLDPKELVTFKELLLSNVYTQEALVNLLEKKDILSVFAVRISGKTPH